MQNAVIVSAVRTPVGMFLGSLKSHSAPHLGSVAIRAAIARTKMSASEVDEVIMGQVLQAGAGQAPARQAAIGADVPSSIPCTTVNKVCGSGLKAVMMAQQSIALGDSKIVVAGGMESMSNAPYLLPTARAGMRLGNQQAIDAIIFDGLWDPYGKAHMGCFGDQCAAHFGFTREAQDAYARTSYERAILAQKSGWFESEIVAVDSVNTDEEPSRFMPEKMGSLKPAFSKDGTVTAANASKINDGAAALVVMSEEEAVRRGLKPLAKIIASATSAQEPAWFTTAPIKAIRAASKKCGLELDQIDYFEINEAFSVVAMAAMHELKLSHERVNIWGGAVALGHPLGASGARILTTLLSILRQNNGRYGCASLCLGGGEAVAMVVENMYVN